MNHQAPSHGLLTCWQLSERVLPKMGLLEGSVIHRHFSGVPLFAHLSKPSCDA